MEKIGKSFANLTRNNDFQKRLEVIKNETLSHPGVREFLEEHRSSINSSIIDKNLMKLYEYSTQTRDCSECPSLAECKNMMKGYMPKLKLRGQAIELVYERCVKKTQDDEKRNREKLIQSFHISKDILNATLADVHIKTKAKIEAVAAADRFIDDYVNGHKPKALYLHGSFGVGKTYLLGAIANDLADKQIPSLIIYIPDFLRDIKAGIADNTINEKLEYVKKVPILMLDDIGAETMSSWARDEVLGPILQYRMGDKLPTFFTSNFNFDELLNHLTFSQRGEREEVKAARIMERIRTLADPYLLDGKNYRQ